ncbi:DinB family protein [Microlunatus sp. Y2014]|uniref:DinB family protein n=1 Tax=Microlunatus sp. Y2014 TaxID=3418488 RepID=UPI003DA73731
MDAELNRRFPGREQQRAADPDELRSAWAALERTWAATLERVAAMPPATVDESVAGEWSFAQTLRHLVHATDMWLGRAVLRQEQPFHPIGLTDAATASDEASPSTSTTRTTPPYEDVLAARADRQRMVGDFVATATPELLAAERPNPHDPDFPETVLSCLHTILEEEWEHHRYAVRDLDTLAAVTSDSTKGGPHRGDRPRT